MIELEITRPYKSFAPVSTRINLPDFVVISGINGSGKTQLLEAIGNLNIGVWDGQKQVKAIKYVAPGGLVVSDSPIASYYTLRVKIDEAIESYNRSVRPRMDEAAFDRHFGKSEAGRFIKAVAKNAGKNINQLDEGDFRRHAPLEPNLDKRDIFGHELSTLCKAYHVKYLENAFHRFRNRTEGIAYEYLEDERFFELYGEKPWTFMNKVLERARLDFYLDFDEKLDRDSAYQVKLVSRISGATVTIAELSSGEKVLMALALAIYNSGVGVQFPELLVMDEPDAHLHPSMTKQFIDVVDHLFVREKGMKVIVTTHSPSTVALAPAESIYVMQRVEPRLLKRGKDEALRNLTAGVPTLSINYENRKQVFVESNNDVFFYDRIYEKLKPYLTPEISLSFISSGVGGQGNCDQVKEIVNTLNKFGNHSVYGIIDWDLKNNGNDHVRVLGKDRRYSIENYLFDPILTALFLLREKIIKREEVGLRQGEKYTDIANFPAERLQTVADFIVRAVSHRLSILDGCQVEAIHYVGGQIVVVPDPYLKTEGHDLERYLKEAFSPLNVYQKEGALKLEIVKTIVDDMPEFLPADMLELFLSIQS